ncbi:LamG-like jellyroll fold domain-containing protein [Catelliglobosispora koreensis]|uniref:LamG-like jellyroll fold domain-containing protein n=1 Tax=Catelliglobosispora koreensis TaxID=129052 RepID=UPI00146A0DCE|nr:LamG-like jellyroll fold domain-containing protein [Catelliglobosispora koreensis]
MLFGLTVAVPSGQQFRGGEFPLAGLFELLSARPSWAVSLDPPAGKAGDGKGLPHQAAETVAQANASGKPKVKTPGALPEQSQPVKADEPETKTSGKTGYVEGKSVWLPDESSEYTNRYRNPDGSISNRVFQSAVNFRGTDGKLRPISTTLREAGDGRWQTAESPVKVSVAGFIKSSPGGAEAATFAAEAAAGTTESVLGASPTTTELASVTFPGGQELGYSMLDARIARGVQAGSAVTYRDVQPGIDVELVALSSGIKETLVLKRRVPGNSWVFPLRLKGLTAKVDVDGSIALIGTDGKPVAAIPRGYMQDSKVAADGEFTTSNGVTYELITVDGQQALKITADKKWLDDPARVYPVEIDPTAQLWDDLNDIYVDASGIQDINSLGVGCFGTPCDRRRAFLSFANFGSYAYGPPANSLYGMRITGANLHLFHTWSEDCPSTRSVAAYQVAESWSRTSIRHGKYPGANLGPMIGDLYISNNSPACTNTGGNRTIGTWWTMNITNLNIFNEWSLDYTKNHGIALVSENDDDRKGWKRFTSRNHDPANGWYAPYIDFTWEYNTPPQIERQFPAWGYSSPTLNPELLVTAKDNDGWPRAMNHVFEIWPLGGAAPVATQDSAATSFRVPDGALKWGQTYQWRVQSNDGRHNTEGDWHILTTPVPQPPITSSLSQNGGHGFTPTTGNYTTSVVDGPVTSTGPPLAITRSYNSRDPRTTNAFGAGWSSILDAQAAEIPGQVIVTYQTGQNVAFGKNTDGTFHSPQGKYSTFKAVTNPAGYELTDKEGTRHVFTAAMGNGVYGLTSITDIQNRTLELKYENGRVRWIISHASNRTLHVRWTTTGTPRVDQLSTDPLVAGDWNTANYWRYTYSGDLLDKVCQPEPSDNTSCTDYDYGTNTLQPTAVLDARPHTYLKLDEPLGSLTAASSVHTRETAIGVYSNVTLGTAGRPGSPTAATFNGSSSSVEISGKKLPLGALYQTVSVWFKTTAPGVIYSYQEGHISNQGITQWNPALYVDTDGKLRGKLWNGATLPSTSTQRVDDGQWHHAALVGSGGSQTLYVDGVALPAVAGAISSNGLSHAYLGAGKWHGWDKTPAGSIVGYLNGQISDFGWFDRPLTEAQVKLLHSSGKAASSPLTKITRPGGGTQAEVVYTKAGTVETVKDSNGGTWRVSAPEISVNDQSYSTAVLGTAPLDYFRLNDSTGPNAVNEVSGGSATYNFVTLGVDGGPFGDSVDVASFDGETSHVALPPLNYANGNRESTVSLWFRTTTAGVLYSAQNRPISDQTAPNYQPAIYVGTDGKLRGGYWGNGAPAQVTSSKIVTDGAWHHVALSTNGTKHTLYVDGMPAGDVTSALAIQDFGATVYNYLGAGKWTGWPAVTNTVGRFKGQMSDFAYFTRAISAREVETQFAARDRDRSAGAAPYLAAAMTTSPLDYFRLADTSGTQAANQVGGAPAATYFNPKFNVDGPFHAATSAVSFDGSSTYVGLPARDMVGANGGSISLWFNAPKDRAGVLYGYQGSTPPSDINASTGWVPALYVDVDGKLRGKFWDPNGANNQMVSSGVVDDGEWHHAVLAATGNSQSLYLDGVKVGTTTGAITGFGATHASLGSGKWHTWPGTTGWVGWFSGQIAEAGWYSGEVSQAQVTSLFAARDKSTSVPSKVVKVTDPMNGVTSHVYDIYDGRQLEQVDPSGGRTRFGYDAGGFLYSVTDPIGNVTVDEHDTRGNTIARTTCQDYSPDTCSTTYKSYHPDDGTPRSNKVTEVRDGRSANKDDNTYRTTYAYDAAGNQTSVTDPLGRVTRTEYTDGKVIQANIGGLTASGRYVRMNGLVRGYPAGFSLWDLEVFGPTGKDLARGKTVTTSSIEGPTVPGPLAVDGNPQTRWSSAHTDNHWIVVDLGSVQSIERVKLNWETAYGKDYTIDVSTDGTNWTTVKSITNQAVDYIPAGLPWRTTTPGEEVETVSYLLSGEVDYTIDSAGLTTRFGYDTLGRAVSKREVSDTFPAGLLTTYAYDRKSRLVKQTDPSVLDRIIGTKVHQLVTTAEYNFDDQIVKTTQSDANNLDTDRVATVHYNQFGQKDWDLDPEGNRSEYTYDLLGRMKTQKQPDLTVVTMEYDASGRPVLTKVGNKEVEARRYDKAGRLTVKVDGNKFETHYEYTRNNLSKTVTKVDPISGAQFVLESNKYDKAGNLKERRTNNNATLTTYQVDAAGRNFSQTLDPAGVNRTVSYTYAPGGELISARNSDGANSQVVDYIYDAAGRKTSETMSQNGMSALAGHWKFNETSGTTAADATRSFPATGTPTWSSERNGSAAFDGVDDKMSTAGPVLDTTRGYTVSAWIKIADRNGFYAAASQQAMQVNGFYLGYDKGADRWAFTVYNSDTAGSGVAMATSPAAPPLNTWVHLTGVRDTAANQTRLYVNGQLQGTLSNPPAAFASKGPFVVGSYQYNATPGGFLKGGVDDVQAYQSVLSAAQITGVYNGTGPADATAIRTSWKLDQRGLPKSETNPNGHTTEYVFDEAGQLAISTAPEITTEQHQIVSGQVVTGTPANLFQMTSIAYNTFGEAVETKDPRGNHTYVERDRTGEVVSQWMPDYTPLGSSTAIEAVSHTEYDSMGRVKKTTDPLGHETSYQYDAYGQLWKVTAPDLGVTEYTYDDNGQVTRVKDGEGGIAYTEYDFLGRRKHMTQVISQGVENRTTFGYHANGWMASTTPQGRASTTFEHNNAGERTKVIDGKGNATLVAYDFAGREKTITAPDLSYSEITYDFAGRVLKQDQKKGTTVLNTVQMSYDANGNPVSVTDGRNTTSTFTYNPADMLIEAKQPVITGPEPETIITTFGYDVAGNRTRFTDGRGNQFRTTFNTWGLPESQIEPGDAVFTTLYNAAGLPVTQHAPGGVTTTSEYDAVGRPTRLSGTGAEATSIDKVFEYDKVGRTKKLSGPGGDNVLTYDGRGLLTSVTGPSGNSSYSYTLDGLLEQRIDAAGTTAYTYDSIGRLERTANGDLQLDYKYDEMSRVKEIIHGGNGNKRTFGYDDLSRLRTDTLKTSSDALVGKIEYEWDNNSNLTRKVSTGFAGGSDNHYTYDLANRLVEWNNGTTPTTYKYDRSGNRTQAGAKDFEYNGRNQLVSSDNDNVTYTYTPRGTLAATTTGTVSVPTQSDAFGQVIRQYSSATAYSEYTYDGLGRVLKPGFSYTGLGNDLAADPTGTYVRDASNELAGVRSGAASVYAWTDLHTDVVGQFGAASTALSGSTTYDPYGKVTASTGMLGSLGYQSEWTDTSTGRVNMHARWYNPETGQFDSRDAANVSPVPNSGSANRYAYAAGNPMTRMDPSGNDWMSNCKSIGGCIVQGFVNSFDAISAIKKIWGALSNVEQTVKNMANSMKQEANKWKSKIRGMLPGGICGIPFVGGSICDGVAFIGGWACALSGVCEIVDDCLGGNTLKCAEHVGEALAEVVMGILSGGAAAVGKFMLKRLISKFDLPGKNRDNNNNNEDYSSNYNEADERAEKDAIRNSKNNKSNNSKSNNNNSKSNNSKSNNGKGNSGGGSKSSNNKSNGPKSSAGAKQSPPSPPPASQRPEGRDTSPPPVGCQRKHSFNPSTPVLMADGQAKAIGDIKLGEKVAATDPATGETTAQAVTVLHVNLDRELTDVTLTPVGEGEGDASTRGPTTKLETTQNHPFWDVTTGTWVDAKDLKPGTSKVTGPDGDLQLVVAIDNFTGAEQMRDLTVANIHTYYVVADTTPVLVHNNDPCETVVLGLNHPFGGIGSDALAKRLSDCGCNAYTYNGKRDGLGNLEENGNYRWMNMVTTALKDPKRSIAVTLDGLTGKDALEKFTNAVRSGVHISAKTIDDNGTNWELAALSRVLAFGSRSPDSVSWYVGGEKFSSEEIGLPTTEAGWLALRGLG